MQQLDMSKQTLGSHELLEAARARKFVHENYFCKKTWLFGAEGIQLTNLFRWRLCCYFCALMSSAYHNLPLCWRFGCPLHRGIFHRKSFLAPCSSACYFTNRIDPIKGQWQQSQVTIDKLSDCMKPTIGHKNLLKSSIQVYRNKHKSVCTT